MRVDHVIIEKPAHVVSRSEFESDRKHGFVCYEFNPEREEIVFDRRSQRQIRRKLDADIGFRCTECQFDTLDLNLIKKHIELGQHIWPYTPFENPYGNCSLVVIEGIEDYAAFVADKENRYVASDQRTGNAIQD